MNTMVYNGRLPCSKRMVLFVNAKTYPQSDVGGEVIRFVILKQNKTKQLVYPHTLNSARGAVRIFPLMENVNLGKDVGRYDWLLQIR